MKKFLKSFLGIVAVLFGFGSIARADVDMDGPLAAAETMFDGLDTITGTFTTYFGIVVTLAILVTGFFLGRKWLRRVG